MTQYRLISYKLCPYVQRAVIALEEKGAEYEVEYIELAQKPAWFLELSSLGKVAILQVGSEVIFESAVISEFVDETTEGPRLHPADPLQRAKHRAWIEFTSAALVDAYRLQMAADEGKAREHAATLRERLRRYEEQLGDGPYFSGATFSLVDAAAAPLLQRLGYCDELGVGLGLFVGRSRVSRWRDALLARPSVQRSSVARLSWLSRWLGRPEVPDYGHFARLSWLSRPKVPKFGHFARLSWLSRPKVPKFGHFARLSWPEQAESSGLRTFRASQLAEQAKSSEIRTFRASQLGRRACGPSRQAEAAARPTGVLPRGRWVGGRGDNPEG